MLDDRPTTDDVLDAWRDAVRAAQLAERLADVAALATGRREFTVSAARTLAGLADQTSVAASATERRARPFAGDARSQPTPAN